MQISYCRQWSRHWKYPNHVLSESEARRLHGRGKLYTVLVGDPLRPECFLEFTAFRSVSVEFLNSALCTYFDYGFQEKRPGELFLSMSSRPEFDFDNNAPNRATVLYFKTDGRLTTVRYVSNPSGVGSKIVGEEHEIVDVTHNWEPFPEFGHYEGIARLDRGTPLLRPAFAPR